MPDEFWVYLAVYVLLAVAGFIYQEKDFLFKKKLPENQANNKDGLNETGADEEEKPLLEDANTL